MTEPEGGQIMLLSPEEKERLARIEEDAELADRAFQIFRRMQTEYEMEAKDFYAAKADVRKRLAGLRAQLDALLASEYVKNPKDKTAFEKWRSSHQPFHWFVEFYGVMHQGGFDVIIGNPPYIEMSKVNDYIAKGFSSIECGNLYCLVIERSLLLSAATGSLGLIVPLSLSSTERMKALRNMLSGNLSIAWLSHYSGDANPSKLFEGVKFRLEIILGRRGTSAQVLTSKYLKWFAAERPFLFSEIEYCSVPESLRYLGLFPKLGTELASAALAKILVKKPLGEVVSSSEHQVYVHRVMTMFIKCFDFIPYFSNEVDGVKRSEDYKVYHFTDLAKARTALCAINSSTFFFYFVVLGDCFHCGKEFVLSYPLGVESVSRATVKKLSVHADRLMTDLKRNRVRRKAVSERTGAIEYDEFWPSRSKSIIDRIDELFAQHYGFTEEEMDWILNYDIKYRMGQDAEEVSIE